MTHTQHSPEGIYPGVRTDWRLLGRCNSVGDAAVGPISPFIVVPFAIVDLPLSATLDTLLLPIDLTYDPNTGGRRY